MAVRICTIQYRLNSKGYTEARIQKLKDNFQIDVKVEDLITCPLPAPDDDSDDDWNNSTSNI